jgi:hypothetical protein
VKPEEPGQVKLICGILYSEEQSLEKAFNLMKEQFGPIDYRSENFAFDLTDYYAAEMGSPITRFFISFEHLVHPGKLAQIKQNTNLIEHRTAVGNQRKVNIDSGYMDYDKVVLASAKYNGQKIYLDQGIWADLTLHYTRGYFEPYPWSFPDFKQGIYNSIFLEIRKIYKVQMKMQTSEIKR